MGKIGLITFHSAYNFGSTLQAYATQKTIETLGYDCQIINYRMNEQKSYYSLYRTSYGAKTFVKDLMQLPMHAERVARASGYEKFISKYMNLTKEVSEPNDVYAMYDQFDQIVSGSDQIWNKHANELHRAAWEYMYPYLLKGFSGKKISYASSTGNMLDPAELRKVAAVVKDFSSISMREKTSAETFSKLLKRDIPVVLDPTLLFNRESWIDMLPVKKISGDPYIMYYSLCGIKGYKAKIEAIKKLSQKRNMKVILVTPLASTPFLGSNIEPHPEYSTIEFLNAIFNANMIVTDSYHGSLFSLNFNKDIYSICGQNVSDFRKTDIFKRVGLEDRLVKSIDEVGIREFTPIDYDKVNTRLDEFRASSIKYLKDALSD